MKSITSAPAWPIAIAAAVLGFSTHVRALTSFGDNFNSGASPLWGNEVGAWTASGGVYYATAPNNAPNAYSSLPFNLTDFSVDFDVNNVSDGGIFLRMAPLPGTTLGVQGILLNLKVPDGGPKIYWHIFYDGNNASPPLNISYLSYGNNPHVHIEVSGNTYSAFLNGSSTAATTLTATEFSSGRVALYDFSAQSFDNFVLQEVPEPSATLLLIVGMSEAACWRRVNRSRGRQSSGE